MLRRMVFGAVALGVALTLMTDTAEMQDNASDAEAAAKKLIDDFFVAFNAKDNDALTAFRAECAAVGTRSAA